jgi:hypothetical protein
MKSNAAGLYVVFIILRHYIVICFELTVFSWLRCYPLEYRTLHTDSYIQVGRDRYHI